MTDCNVYYEELLDAAPDELAGVAPTTLSDHVRNCQQCGETARVLLAEHARLGTALAALQPRASADESVDDILALVEEPRRHSRRARLQRFAAAAFPMAAAAGIAMYAVYGRDQSPPVTSTVVVTPPQPARVRITAPPGMRTIVLTTSDPTITFAWIGPEIIP